MKEKMWRYVLLTYCKIEKKLKSNIFDNKLFDFNYNEHERKCDFTEKRYYVVDLNNINNFYYNIYNIITSSKNQYVNNIYSLKKEKTISELQKQFILINYDKLDEIRKIKTSKLFVNYVYEKMLHNLELFKNCTDYDFMNLAINEGLVFNNETNYLIKINNSNMTNYHTRIMNIDVFNLD